MHVGLFSGEVQIFLSAASTTKVIFSSGSVSSSSLSMNSDADLFARLI